MSDISESTPVADVAAHALRDRFDLIEAHLPGAANAYPGGIHDVHQLRVSTRRAAAALRVFEEFLPEKRVGKIRKLLRSIRRAAGPARDLDVLYGRLAEPLSNRRCAEAIELLSFILQQRQAVQPPLRKLLKQQLGAKLERQATKLLKSMQHSELVDTPTLAQFAPCALNPLVKGFFEASERDLSVPHWLHQLRIEGKRLRYALELLSEGCDESLRLDVYPVFVEVQDRLGDINDHTTAIHLFTDWRKNTAKKQRSFLKKMIRSEKKE
ncbi:MAG: CHAD domain-containing protein, partial [Planctomycetales bacterium]|nr:CHAD domain-containing protein [Planctomycetales bacterium]